MILNESLDKSMSGMEINSMQLREI